MTTENKLGIKEVTDVFKFADGFLGKLIAAKDDDGKISTGELVAATTTSIPSAVTAWAGKDQIDEELKELSSEELMQLANMSTELVNKILSLVLPGVTKEA